MATRHGRGEYLGKRALDLSAVIVTAPLWLPLLMLVAALIWLRLGRPIFFVQQRPGKGGRLFPLIKFRTMALAAPGEDTPLSDAQRLSPFGRRLRSTSLDELPELLNVLAGQMSLVGPRPLLAQYLPLYSARHQRRHDVPPGITGLAQISGRNAISWPDRFDLDVRYVEEASLTLDLKILVRTVLTVVRRDGISAAGEATMTPFTGYPPQANDEEHR